MRVRSSPESLLKNGWQVNIGLWRLFAKQVIRNGIRVQFSSHPQIMEVVRSVEDIVLKTTGRNSFKGSSPFASAKFDY